MAYAPFLMCQSVLSAADAVLFVASGDTLPRQVILANPSASPVTVRLGIAPLGTTIGDATLLIPSVTIPPHDALDPQWWQVIPSGGRLFGSASAAGVIVLTASGVLLE
jgi:hypothetical protein